MVGKMALSLDKAQLAKDANLPKPSPIWSLPDDVLTWVLLCYEGAGQEGPMDRAHQKNNFIKSFDEAARTGNDPMLAFEFGQLGDRTTTCVEKAVHPLPGELPVWPTAD
jgi:hypothetical protein